MPKRNNRANWRDLSREEKEAILRSYEIDKRNHNKLMRKFSIPMGQLYALVKSTIVRITA